MKLHLLAIAGLTIGFASPAMSQETTGTCTGPQDDCRQISSLAKRFDETFNKKDAVAFAANYTPDGIVLLSMPMLSGRAAIAQAFSEFFKLGASHLVDTVTQAHVAGDMAWAFGGWSDTEPGPNNTTQSVHGNWSAVYVRDGGTWLIRQSTANVIRPPPPQ
jgi:uncharacterized protein (TIGR02246 family)